MAAPLNAAQIVKSQQFMVSDALASRAAQQCARRMALALGFTGTASEQVVLSVAELVSNLVKHAGTGTLTLLPLFDASRIGIEVETSDDGPGIADVEQSFADGYSTSGSLGYGLGTVNRLMDEVDVYSTPGAGTRIVCRRWVRDESIGLEAGHLWDVGVFTRPRGLAPDNGDAFVVKRSDSELLVGLIDGLGHGPLAQKAALAAQQYVLSHDAQPLDKIFFGVGRACKATRGVVMALARFTSSNALQFAALGNIEVRAWTGKQRLPFVFKRGFLGSIETTVHTQEFPWNSEWLLVMHSDGLRTHWQWSDFPGIETEPAQVAASRLMRALAEDNDDATVLAVRRAQR
ncbi:MAG TPA: anti-sigma regulatory factor [Candidatus Acidoferrum sp.]|nr:anti-sigma regulatory factor [Candidatus Acidoferrum sp.]